MSTPIKLRAGAILELTNGRVRIDSIDAGAVTLTKIPELPTEPGLYEPYADSVGKLHTSRKLLRTIDGEWFWVDFTAHNQSDTFQPADVDKLERAAYNLVPVYTDQVHPKA